MSSFRLPRLSYANFKLGKGLLYYVVRSPSVRGRRLGGEGNVLDSVLRGELPEEVQARPFGNTVGQLSDLSCRSLYLVIQHHMAQLVLCFL